MWFVSLNCQKVGAYDEVTQKRAVELWKRIRLDVLRIANESEALLEDQPCSVCTTGKATHRCLQCGPRIFFCSHCVMRLHIVEQIYTIIGEIWEVNILSAHVTWVSSRVFFNPPPLRILVLLIQKLNPNLIMKLTIRVLLIVGSVTLIR